MHMRQRTVLRCNKRFCHNEPTGDGCINCRFCSCGETDEKYRHRAKSRVDNPRRMWYNASDKLHSRSIFGGSDGIRLRLGDDRALTRRT